LFWEDRRQDFVRGFSSMFGSQVNKLLFGRRRRDTEASENGVPQKRQRNESASSRLDSASVEE
ncbi:hypothetical protein FBU59_005051, partial [Linderina macrospora]